MTDAEFQQFIGDFTARFPDDGTWLVSKPATAALWFKETFSALDFQECAETSIRISNGTIGGWKSFERATIPLVYRRDVHARAYTARVNADAERKVYEARIRASNAYVGILEAGDQASEGGPSMMFAFEHMKEMRNRGDAQPERKAWLDDYFAQFTKTPNL